MNTTTAPAPDKVITLSGRDFTVKAYTGAGCERMPYMLVGPRGATYGVWVRPDGSAYAASISSGELRIHGNVVRIAIVDGEIVQVGR